MESIWEDLELNISIPLTLSLMWHLTDKRVKGFEGLVCPQEGAEEGETFGRLYMRVLVLRHRRSYVRHAEANLSGVWWVSVTKIAALLEESSSLLRHAKYSRDAMGLLSTSFYRQR